jgi:hypothetical protein
MHRFHEYINEEKPLEVGDLCVWGGTKSVTLEQWTYLVLELRDNGKNAVILRFPDKQIYRNVPVFNLLPLTPPTS